MATMHPTMTNPRERGPSSNPFLQPWAALPQPSRVAAGSRDVGFEADLALAELFPDLQAAADAALADLFPALRVRRRAGA